MKVLDDQGVEFAWILPSLGLGIEEMLKDDREGLPAVARAYNMWLDDDWGYDRDGRIQTAPSSRSATPTRRRRSCAA